MTGKLKEKMRVAILASGQGTNLQAILDAGEKGLLGPAEVALVISDVPDSGALNRGKKAGIKTVLVDRKKYTGKREFEDRVIGEILSEKVDLIVLAGFMRVLSKKFVDSFPGRIINIHPSLLPAFKGVSGIADAYEHGVKITGVTVHFVDEGVDSGPIILQGAVVVDEGDTLEALEAKIHALEHRLYPRAIRYFVEGKLEVKGIKVKIKN